MIETLQMIGAIALGVVLIGFATALLIITIIYSKNTDIDNL